MGGLQQLFQHRRQRVPCQGFVTVLEVSQVVATHLCSHTPKPLATGYETIPFIVG